jgi:hypothetical protein
MSASVNFTVNTHYQPPQPNYPKILLLSPQNQTYMTSELPLTFTTSEQVVNYLYVLTNLDSSKFSKDASLSGNITLTGLSNGTYKLFVSVLTQSGYAGQTTYFNIDNLTTPETPTNTNNSLSLQNPLLFLTLALAAVAIVIILSALILAIQRYRRKQSKTDNKGTLNVNQGKS